MSDGTGLAIARTGAEQRTVCIMGIDPGSASGAIAFYFPTFPKVITAEDLPVVDGQVDAVTLAQRIEQMDPDMAVVEDVHSMPKQGVASTFKFGVAFGIVRGIIAARQIPVHFVTPSKWKKHYGLNGDKDKSRKRAQELWPESTAFGRRRDDGRAEAALLAKYGVNLLEIAP